MEILSVGPTVLVLAQIPHLNTRQVERSICRCFDTYPHQVRGDLQILAIDHCNLRVPKGKHPTDPRAKQPYPAGALEISAMGERPGVRENDIAADLGAIRNQCISLLHIQLPAPAIQITLDSCAWQPD